jgi:hypothetical protein
MLKNVVDLLPAKTFYLVATPQEPLVSAIYPIYFKAPVKGAPHCGAHRRVHPGRVPAAGHYRQSFNHSCSSFYPQIASQPAKEDTRSFSRLKGKYHLMMENVFHQSYIGEAKEYLK